MYCRNCGEELAENQDVCLKCGVKKGKGNKYCPNCGTEVENELQAICLKCGASLENKTEEQKWTEESKNYNGNSKLTIALLCFFLGSFGVHNFIMGETKKGIFKIVMSCCFGISIIFVLIDFVKILTDKYEIDPNKLI